MAVKQDVNLRLRAVNCCEPALKPMFPSKDEPSTSMPMWFHLTSEERQITHKPTTSILHENSYVGSVATLGHDEINILEGGCL